MSLNVDCKIGDIQENLKNGTTKYLCNNDSWNAYFHRVFNDTSYNYRTNMTFELPSRHLMVQGTGQ